jgi:hypothetical protein
MHASCRTRTRSAVNRRRARSSRRFAVEMKSRNKYNEEDDVFTSDEDFEVKKASTRSKPSLIESRNPSRLKSLESVLKKLLILLQQ